MTKTCMLIHGFTGGPYEVEPLAVKLKRRGYKVEIPLLAGHGADRRKMRGVTFQDWIDSADHACEKAFTDSRFVQPSERILVGFSMGSWIAAYLANAYTVHKLVMISPPYFYPNPKQVILDGVRFILGKDLSAAKYFKQYSRKIRLTPVTSVLELKKLVAHCSSSLSEITIPTLVLQGELDHVVQPHGAARVYESIGSQQKEIRYFKRSRHLLCLDEEKEEVIDRIVRFIEQPHNIYI